MLPDFNVAVAKFRIALDNAHLTHSRHRRILLNEFWHAGKPVTEDELYHLVASHGVSRTTVRRTIKILRACGLAQEVEPRIPACCGNCGSLSIEVTDGGWRCNRCGITGESEPAFAPAEAAPCAHAHLICQDCGAAIDQPSAEAA